MAGLNHLNHLLEEQATIGVSQPHDVAAPAPAQESLADFWRRSRDDSSVKAVDRPGPENLLVELQIGITIGIADMVWRDERKEEFAKKLSMIVNDDKFINEVSKSVGLPKKGELEGEYVERGKTIFRAMVRRALAITD